MTEHSVLSVVTKDFWHGIAPSEYQSKSLILDTGAHNRRVCFHCNPIFA